MQQGLICEWLVWIHSKTMTIWKCKYITVEASAAQAQVKWTMTRAQEAPVTCLSRCTHASHKDDTSRFFCSISYFLGLLFSKLSSKLMLYRIIMKFSIRSARNEIQVWRLSHTFKVRFLTITWKKMYVFIYSHDNHLKTSYLNISKKCQP